MTNKITAQKLTPEEISLLQDYQKASPFILMRFKSTAMLMVHNGGDVSLVAKTLNKSERTVKRWQSDFSKKRMSSIFTGHKDNENASKLTKEQRKEIKDALSSPPSKYKLPTKFWSVPSIKNYVSATFSVVYETIQSYHFLLKFCGYSFKYPSTFDVKRNIKKINMRLNQIRNEISPLLKDSTWEVFASDETRIQLEAEIRRAWLKKGEETVIKVERKKEARNYLGFLNLKNHKCSLFKLEWQNQEQVIEALKKLVSLYPDKKLCVIWDNAPFHKGKKIREELKKGNALENVHLINFPPYAPDKNPIEKIWGLGKKALANIQRDKLTTVEKIFEKAITLPTFKYTI